MTDHRDDELPDDLFDADVDERLADWVDDRLSERDRERFEAELRVSPQLRQRLEEYQATVATVQAALRAPTQGTEIADRVMATLAEQASRPIVPRRAAWPIFFAIATAAALLAVAVWVDSWGAPEHADNVADAPTDGLAPRPDDRFQLDQRLANGALARTGDERSPAAAEPSSPDTPDASAALVPPGTVAAAPESENRELGNPEQGNPEPKKMLDLEVSGGQVRRMVEVPPTTAPIESEVLEVEAGEESQRREAQVGAARSSKARPDPIGGGKQPAAEAGDVGSPAAPSAAAPDRDEAPMRAELGGGAGGAKPTNGRGGRSTPGQPAVPTAGGGGGAGGPATAGPAGPVGNPMGRAGGDLAEPVATLVPAQEPPGVKSEPQAEQPKDLTALPEGLARPDVTLGADKVAADDNFTVEKPDATRSGAERERPGRKSADEAKAADARDQEQGYRGPGDVVPNSPPLPRVVSSMPRFAISGDAGEVLAMLTIEGPPPTSAPVLGGTSGAAQRRMVTDNDARTTQVGRLDAFLAAQMQRAGETASAGFAIGGLRFTPVASASGTASSGEAGAEPQTERNWFVEGSEPELAALLAALRRFADADGRSLRAGEIALMPPIATTAGAGQPSSTAEAGVVSRRLVLRFRPRSD